MIQEDAILLPEIVDAIFLVAIHPASQGQHEEVQSVGHGLRLTWFRHGRHPTLSGDSLASAVSPAIRGRTGRGRVSRRPASHQHMPDLVRQFARGVGVSRQASPLASFAPPGRAATRPPVARLPLNGLGGGRDCFCRVAPPES